VIVSAAFCPNPPLLLPELAQGAADELAPLRAAADEAISDMLAAKPDRVLLIGAGPTSLLHSPLARGSMAGYGLDREIHLGLPACGGAIELPLSLTIGAWLLSRVAGPRNGAIGISIGPRFQASRAASDLLGMAGQLGLEGSNRLGLLVMGDGSARRSTEAPGYFDERAAGFDDSTSAALRDGDADALADLDVDLAEQLMCAGAPAWVAAGDLLADQQWAARVLYADAPYGVGYVVASWRRAGVGA
jgi:hypothetical protein